MIDHILLRFRNRWHVIVLIVVMTLASSPTPLNQVTISRINRSAIALQSGQVADALNNVETILDSDPGHAWFHLLASDLAYHVGEMDRSSQHLKAALSQFPNGEVGFCRQARNELGIDRGKIPDPNWGRFIRECKLAFERMSLKLLSEFDTTPAEDLIPYFDYLIQANPDVISIQQAYARLQSVYAPKDALQKLRTLSNLESNRSTLERDLLRAINSALEEKDAAFTFAQVGQVFARYQEWKLAKLAFQRALSEEPEYLDARAYLGLAEEQLGLDGSAHINSAISADPQNPRYYAFLAVHHQQRGEIELARDALDQAARLDPENPAIAAQLGSVYADLGDFTAAAQAYLVATDLAPKDPRFWLLLAGFSLEYDQDLQELGLAAARNAVALEPGSARGYEMLAAVQFNLEQYRSAERSLDTALNINPRSANAQYQYGLLMLTYGRREVANAAFRAATIIDENGQYAELAARLLN
ncbi:MAG: tetratricopeptide repeat protein [Anaerolineales bacterium]|jgi:tetratricopeptide (TPR) repeat protein